MSLQYQAVHEGLIAQPKAGFNNTLLKEKFSIPDEYILIAVIAVVYGGDDSELSDKHKELEHSPRSRLPQDKLVGIISGVCN